MPYSMTLSRADGPRNDSVSFVILSDGRESKDPSLFVIGERVDSSTLLRSAQNDMSLCCTIHPGDCHGRYTPFGGWPSQ